MIKFPYGISDFYKLVTGGYFYVDRTDRIPLIEEMGDQLLFLRPRRFGKSLLLSMLENYYDVAKAEAFEQLFGHLAIGRNPTPLRNQYLVMKWDFSVVDPQGSAQEVKRALHDHINAQITIFAQRYQDVLKFPVRIDEGNAIASLESVSGTVRQSPYRLYLLIDEYDNFANEVMMSGRSKSRADYDDLVSSEGSLKTVFKAVKAAGSGGGLDRAFITGVSPIVMSDMTSGYNIAKNIYLKSQFNDLCGFWETEIAGALHQIVAECGFAPEKAAEALTMMRTFYNGYCFSYDTDDLVYNPTLALYFMDDFQERCQSPYNMLDSNFSMDQAKIAYVARLPNGKRLILDAAQDETPVSVSRLEDRFGVAKMLAATHDTRFLASLLYYLGVLTLGGWTPHGELILQIPNLVARRLYLEQIQQVLLPDSLDQEQGRRAAKALYQMGDMQPLCDFVEQRYFKVLDNRDYRWANEMTVKTAFLTLLFNDTFYIVDSETALERGYADLTLIVRPEMRQYQLLDILIEFKYVKLGDEGLSGEQARRMSTAELKELPHIQRQLSAAEKKLQNYRASLEAKYGEKLRLQSYAVVALGFDRLVWQECV